MSESGFEVLTMLLTIILLSPTRPEPLAGVGFAALRAGLTFFLMPPAGAAGAAGRPPARRVERRPAALRWVERISSKDWSSLPDMMEDVGMLIK